MKNNQNQNQNQREESQNKDVKEINELKNIAFPDYQPLEIKLPKMQYSKEKFSIIPLNTISSNNWRFHTIKDAANYLFKHCKKHHKLFSLKLAELYSKFCFVFDESICEMVPLHKYHKRIFTQACQKLIRDSQ
jgi:hypothetical protein